MGVSLRRIADAFALDVIGSRDIEVDSVVSDNRRVRAGDLFVALPGARVHGSLFAAAAVAAGARAILTDQAGAEQIAMSNTLTVPMLVTSSPREILGPLAAYVHRAPATHLRTFGLTGTNGKTTSSFLLDRILVACGLRTGLIGTVETRSAGVVVPSVLTTPEAPELQEWLARMVEDDVDCLTMEVSSHSLSMHRVDGLEFDVVGFTNLSQDHLDFHGDLESYFRTKASLFTPAHARTGVVIVDTAWGRRLADDAQIPVVRLATAPDVEGGEADDVERVAQGTADWRVHDVDARPERTWFSLTHRDGRTIRTSITLPGAFNVSNAALALTMAIEGGIEIAAIEAALADAGIDATVPGRMEIVGAAPRVVVDFAHNADALGLALDALRISTPGRLIVVFGATGERDTGKRPIMARVAAEHADIVIVSDDDPHGEDPAHIREDVLAGLAHAADEPNLFAGVAVLEIAPRADAIQHAIWLAHPSDTVLIAGRGHETIQEVAGVDVPLDDRVAARAAHGARRARRTSRLAR